MKDEMSGRMRTYLRSPAGCDGGNIAGANWLFGVEPGGAVSAEVFNSLEIGPEHGHVAEHDVVRFAEECPYNRNLAKFEAARLGWPVGAYREFAEEARLFSRGSEYYKGNVGAFNFPHDDRESFEPYKELIGLSSKQELKRLEIDVRAEMFQEWLHKQRPSCLICFGTGDSDRFLRAFSDRTGSREGWHRLEGLRYYHSIVNGGRTSLFILPHLTAPFHQGLTSDYRLTAFGDRVRATMIAEDFELVGPRPSPQAGSA